MIAPESRIVRSPNAAWREIDGQVAIVSIDVNRVRLLNEVGGHIWKVCDGSTVEQIIESIQKEFDVTEATARADVATFIDDLAKRGMVRIQEPG